MPMFHFECGQCHTLFDVKMPFGTKELPPCPECKGTKVRKLIRPPMVHFKGTGFYKTDSRGTPAAQPAAKPAEPAKPATPPPTPSTSPASEPKKP